MIILLCHFGQSELFSYANVIHCRVVIIFQFIGFESEQYTQKLGGGFDYATGGVSSWTWRVVFVLLAAALSSLLVHNLLFEEG